MDGFFYFYRISSKGKKLLEKRLLAIGAFFGTIPSGGIMNYPQEIAIALGKLTDAGFEAYLVGGCVRDFLMKRRISDYDIATSANPEEIQELFRSYAQNPIGQKYGTIGVYIGEKWLEITTYRLDGLYINHRQPENVAFTSDLKEDLMRRDFTINALAFSQKSGIVDYCESKKDLENKLIRSIGNPQERFQEDALRILRAVRFASQLDFSIEQNTLDAMIKNLPLLEQVSAERKAVELIKTLQGAAIERVLLDYPEIFASVLPELLKMKGFDQKSPHHIYDLLTHIAKVVANTPNDKELRLAALLHDTGKIHTFSVDENGVGHFYGHGKMSELIAKRFLEELKIDSKTADEVILLVRYHDAQIERNKKIIRRWLGRLGEELFFKLLLLKRADNSAQAPNSNRQEEYDQVEWLAMDVIEEKECFSLKSLAVNGNDLLSIGFFGPQLGEALGELLTLVIDELLPNNKEALLQKARELYDKQNYFI